MKGETEMDKILKRTAKVLAKITYSSAVAGAGTASLMGIYQPKTPKSLLK